MMYVLLTKNLLYKMNPYSAAYDQLVLTDAFFLINGIKHVIFEHKIISAN